MARINYSIKQFWHSNVEYAYTAGGGSLAEETFTPNLTELWSSTSIQAVLYSNVIEMLR